MLLKVGNFRERVCRVIVLRLRSRESGEKGALNGTGGKGFWGSRNDVENEKRGLRGIVGGGCRSTIREYVIH